MTISNIYRVTQKKRFSRTDQFTLFYVMKKNLRTSVDLASCHNYLCPIFLPTPNNHRILFDSDRKCNDQPNNLPYQQQSFLLIKYSVINLMLAVSSMIVTLFSPENDIFCTKNTLRFEHFRLKSSKSLILKKKRKFFILSVQSSFLRVIFCSKSTQI